MSRIVAPRPGEWRGVNYTTIESIDGGHPESVNKDYSSITMGFHTISLYVKWSNGYIEPISFQFEATKKRYFALAHELSPGEKKEDAIIRPFNSLEIIGRGILAIPEGAAAGVLLLPGLATVAAKKNIGE